MRRFPIEQPLSRKLFRISRSIVAKHPQLISKLKISDITPELIKILNYNLSKHEDFIKVLDYLYNAYKSNSELHNIKYYYVCIFVNYLCKNGYALFDYEKFCMTYYDDVMKVKTEDHNSSNFPFRYNIHNLVALKEKTRQSLGTDFDNKIHVSDCFKLNDLCCVLYRDIMYNTSSFNPNTIKYVNYKRLSTYDYFNICRFCCEQVPQYIIYIDPDAFSSKTKKYYFGLIKYIELIYKIPVCGIIKYNEYVLHDIQYRALKMLGVFSLKKNLPKTEDINETFNETCKRKYNECQGPPGLSEEIVFENDAMIINFRQDEDEFSEYIPIKTKYIELKKVEVRDEAREGIQERHEMHMKDNNLSILTLTLVQSFKFKSYIKTKYPKTKIFKNSYVELDTDEVNEIVEEIYDFVSSIFQDS